MKKFLNLSFIFLLIFLIVGCESIFSTTKETTQATTSSNLTTTSSLTSLTSENLGYNFDMDGYLKGLESRKEYLTDFLFTRHNDHSTGKFGFGISALKMRLYFETNDQSYFDDEMLQAYKCYQNLESNQFCFAAYHYGLFNEYYSDELKAYAKEVFVNSKAYAGSPSTTNHALTFAVGTYLANQYFPGEIKTEYYGYDNKQTDDPTAEKTLYKVLKSYPITGVYENNSDTYFVIHFLAMLALAECAEDETLRSMAQTALHNSIFTFATVWLNGHISVAQQRNYSPSPNFS